MPAPIEDALCRSQFVSQVCILIVHLRSIHGQFAVWLHPLLCMITLCALGQAYVTGANKMHTVALIVPDFVEVCYRISLANKMGCNLISCAVLYY